MTGCVADVHLGKLVRRLRLLGLDCARDLSLDDPAIAGISAREKRILLTRDRRLLMRRIVTHGIFLHSDDPDTQTEQVLDRLDLQRSLRPFSRCSSCNGELSAVEKYEVEARVPPYTYATYDDFFECTRCDKVY